MPGVGTGGVSGRGLMHGVQKLFYLPEPHTDFIFAVISEELGLIGGTFVLLCFCVIAWRGLRIALRAQDALLDVGQVARDGAQRALRVLQTIAQVEQHRPHHVGQRHRQSLADEVAEHVAHERRGLGERCHDGGVVEDAPQHADDAQEPAAADLAADRVAHDVLELVGLVEDHGIVVGQDADPRASQGQIAKEQRMIHDQQLGILRATTGLIVETVLVRGTLPAQAVTVIAGHLVPDAGEW